MENIKKTILLADDEEDTLSIIKSFLEANGFSVITAKDGEEAYDIIQNSKPDIVVLDIMMPILDGFTLNRKLKLDNNTKNIPVIITTAKTRMKEVFENSPETEINYLLEKPFKLKILVEKINEILNN